MHSKIIEKVGVVGVVNATYVRHLMHRHLTSWISNMNFKKSKKRFIFTDFRIIVTISTECLYYTFYRIGGGGVVSLGLEPLLSVFGMVNINLSIYIKIR